MGRDGYIKPPPGLLPEAPKPEGVPEREQIQAVPGGMPLFTPNPGHVTGPTIPMPRPAVGTPPAAASPAAPAPPASAPAASATPAPASAPAAEFTPPVHVTRLDSVPSPSWSLALQDGTRLPLAGSTFVGRNPVVSEAAPDAVVLPLADPAKSLSKTHALLVPQLAYLMVTDLHSTNGVAVIGPDGGVTVLEPGRSAAVRPGSTLQLGSFAVTVLAEE